MAAVVPVGPVAGNPFYDYLTGTLLLSQEVTEKIVGEGLRDFQMFIRMEDGIITNVVSNIRKPGGYIAAGAGRGGAGGRGAGAGGPGRGRGRGRGAAAPAIAPAMVADRGLAVSEVSCTRLRQLGYYCYHLHRICRAFVAADATLDRLEEVWDMRSMEEIQRATDFKEPDPLKSDQGDKAYSAIKVLDQYLFDKRGCKGTPLAYLTRPDAVPPAEADDLGFGEPSFTEELIRRGRHGNYQPYVSDNLFLWSVIRQMCKDGPAWLGLGERL